MLMNIKRNGLKNLKKTLFCILNKKKSVDNIRIKSLVMRQTAIQVIVIRSLKIAFLKRALKSRWQINFFLSSQVSKTGGHVRMLFLHL